MFDFNQATLSNKLSFWKSLRGSNVSLSNAYNVHAFLDIVGGADKEWVETYFISTLLSLYYMMNVDIVS